MSEKKNEQIQGGGVTHGLILLYHRLLVLLALAFLVLSETGESLFNV